MTPEEYERIYGKLYTTSAVSEDAAKKAQDVYIKDNGIPTTSAVYEIPEKTPIYTIKKPGVTTTPTIKYNKNSMTPMLYDTGGYTGMWGP
jgi:hypothetical protein